MSTELKSVGPGWTRSVVEPFTPPQLPPTDLENRASEIKARQSVDDERRYRELVFLYRGRALSDDEAVEITSLADKLGMTPRAIEDHVRAIRQVESAEKIIAEPDADLPAMEATATQSNAEAVEALCQSIADFFRGKPIETIAHAKENIRANCPWLQPHPGIPFELMPKLPDRKCSELASAAGAAKSALDSAKRRKPDAEAELNSLRRANAILWPD